MKKTAIMLMLVGLVFAFFTLPFSGIDLLIDAVGFLIVWNSLRALRLTSSAFATAAWLCLGLVGLSAAQLFSSGLAYTAVTNLRLLLEVPFFLLLLKGFLSLASAAGLAKFRLPLLAVFSLYAIASLLLMTTLYLPAALLFTSLCVSFHFLASAALLVTLLLFARSIEKT